MRREGIGGGAPTERRWGAPVTMLTAYLVTLLVVPSDYVLAAPLGDIGRPSVVLGIAFALLWPLTLVSRHRAAIGYSPVRIIIAIYFFVWNTSVGLAFLRGLSAAELAGAERFYLKTISLCGVALAMSEMLPDRRSLDTLLRRLTVIGAAMGTVGTLQFYTSIDLVQRIRLPLPVNGDIELGLGTRGSADLTRAAATTQHSIEYGVISAMLLPIAIHFALATDDPRERRWRWLIAILCGSGVPLSLARSGVIAVAIAFIVLLRGWRPAFRLKALATAGVAIVALRLTTPGLVGTFISFFSNASSDNSVEGRTQDYDDVWRIFTDHPILGLGGGTFRPEEYFILDNYVLNALVSTGVLGLVALLVLFLGPYSLAIRVGRSAPAAENRHLGFALAASILGAFGASFTFDSLNFPVMSGLVFVLVGLAGALWRFRAEPGEPGRLDGIMLDRADLRPLLSRIRQTPAAPAVALNSSGAGS